MKFSKLLIEEHKRILVALDVLNAMTEQVEQVVDRHDVNALLIFLHYFADTSHQAKEESILFPKLKRSKKYSVSLELDSLLEGHCYERSLIEKTQIALFSDEHSEFTLNAQKLIRILSGHILKEEKVLFPMAEQILSPQEANEVEMEMTQADANFGYAQLNLLIGMLDGLEKKYIRKAA